jgi:hypothetical protein
MLRCFTLIVLVFLAACAGGKKTPQADSQPADTDPPLSQRYTNIIVHEFESTAEIKRDYPGVASECQASVISNLQLKNAYNSVAAFKSGEVYGADTLLVKAKIKEMRLVSTAARIWGGAFAGSSYMDINIMLIDAVSSQEVRNKNMNSHNNAYAAAWVSGASDRSLPADMGKMIADYIITVVPEK